MVYCKVLRFPSGQFPGLNELRGWPVPFLCSVSLRSRVQGSPWAPRSRRVRAGHHRQQRRQRAGHVRQWHDGGVTAANAPGIPRKYESVRKSASPGGRVPRPEANDLLLLVSHRDLARTGSGPVSESGCRRLRFLFFRYWKVLLQSDLQSSPAKAAVAGQFSLRTCNTCNTWVNSFRM